jgi:hypothetical protein
MSRVYDSSILVSEMTGAVNSTSKALTCLKVPRL